MPNVAVTLSVRVWIEIIMLTSVFLNSACHPQCEGVD